MLSSLVPRGVSLCLECMAPPPELHIWDEKELCRSSRREASGQDKAATLCTARGLGHVLRFSHALCGVSSAKWVLEAW